MTILVAVSGGADSVALLRALVEARKPGAGRLIVAHFNHRLRGDESEADQRFVEQLAEQFHLPSAVGVAQQSLGTLHRLASGGRKPPEVDQPDSAVLHALSGQGLEAAARQARYDFLASAAAAHGARYVATAHTADDQVETVLHNILRGTGLAGLAGIPRTRCLSASATLIRPLLDVTRAEVLDYLRESGQPYRDDSTNNLVEFTRNRIRHELLPLLARDYYTGVRQSLLRLAKIASQSNDFLDDECQNLLPRSIHPILGGVEINCLVLTGTNPAVLRQLFFTIWQQQRWPLQDMSLDKWEQLVRLAQNDATTATVNFPGAVLATRAGESLRLTRPA